MSNIYYFVIVTSLLLSHLNYHSLIPSLNMDYRKTNYGKRFECASKTVNPAFCQTNPLDANTQFTYMF